VTLNGGQFYDLSNTYAGKIGENVFLLILSQIISIYVEKRTLVYKKIAFFPPKVGQIVENSYHTIEPG
jgi:hypothetical protein